MGGEAEQLSIFAQLNRGNFHGLVDPYFNQNDTVNECPNYCQGSAAFQIL